MANLFEAYSALMAWEANWITHHVFLWLLIDAAFAIVFGGLLNYEAIGGFFKKLFKRFKKES